jgi:uroporphyrinogen decarboxylase
MSDVPAMEPLPNDLDHTWEHLRLVLQCEGEPPWVPYFEGTIHNVHKARVLGRPPRTVADELAFRQRVGHPFVPIDITLSATDEVKAALRETEVEVGDLLTSEEGTGPGAQRRWAEGTKGVILSEADLEAFPWPDPDACDYSVLDEAAAMLPDGFTIALRVGKVFNLGWWLMGFEGFSYALADNPGLVERIYQKIGNFQKRVVERSVAHPAVGMVWHADDMAYRTGLMVSPRLLRQHVFPFYREMNDICWANDTLPVFHSDGDMNSLIDDIVAAGFCAFNPVEPLAMDIRALKKRVQGKLALIGNVDLSYTLTRGTPAEVEAEVRDLIRDLAPGGGYVLSSANSIPDYVPWENFLAMRSAWLRYGRYPISI